MKYLLILIYFLFSNMLCLHAQVKKEWVVTYDGYGGIDKAAGMSVDQSGNIYVTGYSYSDTSLYDYLTVKYNPSGQLQWQQRFDGIAGSEDIPTSIAVDGSGNAYITGSSTQSGTKSEITTLKYSTMGNQLWVRTFNGSGEYGGSGSSIAVYGSGIVYVAGGTYNQNTSVDFTTLKYNSLGILQWADFINGLENIDDQANAVVTDNYGNAYVTGYIFNGNQFIYDMHTVKYNSSGVKLWSQTYNGTGNSLDQGVAIAVDDSGYVYVTGASRNTTFNYDMVTIKYSPAGTPVWLRRYNGPGNGSDAGNSILVDDSANVYVSGNSQNDMITIKYNRNGIQQWLKTYNGPANGNDNSVSMAADSLWNIYITGESEVSLNVSDIVTIKYSPAGNVLWTEIYNSSSNNDDVPVSVKVDRDNNVIVAGTSYLNGSGFDYVTIKYSQTVGVNQISNQIPVTTSLKQNYPNPFNPNTIISYELAHNAFVSLKVFDALGKELKSLVNENQNAGSYNVEFDGLNLSSGIYFYKLTLNDFTETKRMVLLK